MNWSKLSIYLLLFFALTLFANAQIRVAVLPFENADGRMEFNIYSYQLQDSLTKALIARDVEAKNYQVVPIDSIEILLAELNIDPSNPQYLSDMWKVVDKLNCNKVITGNFNIQGDKFLLNAYIYLPSINPERSGIF